MSEQNFPHTNKFRSLFGVASAIIFTFIGSLVINNSENFAYNQILVKGLGVVTILFFGGLLIYRIKILIGKKNI